MSASETASAAFAALRKQATTANADDDAQSENFMNPPEEILKRCE